MHDNICLFGETGNPLCIPTKMYMRLRETVMRKYGLRHVPSLDDVKKILGINTNIKLEDRVRMFLNDEITDNFRVKVPDIKMHGLSGYNMLKVFDKLREYYEFFHYRGPCLLDYKENKYYDYSDFLRYPLFECNNCDFKVYYILLLTVKLSAKKVGHWIGLCVVNNSILYYDSLNKEIFPEFKSLIDCIYIELKMSHPSVLSWRNTKRVQQTGKHCGVFQIHFLMTVLDLFSKNNLFKADNKLNVDALDHYLQEELKQEVIEDTISNYFYIND